MQSSDADELPYSENQKFLYKYFSLSDEFLHQDPHTDDENDAGQ